jgi:hypothetical protein
MGVLKTLLLKLNPRLPGVLITQWGKKFFVLIHFPARVEFAIGSPWVKSDL